MANMVPAKIDDELVLVEINDAGIVVGMNDQSATAFLINRGVSIPDSVSITDLHSYGFGWVAVTRQSYKSGYGGENLQMLMTVPADLTEMFYNRVRPYLDVTDIPEPDGDAYMEIPGRGPFALSQHGFHHIGSVYYIKRDGDNINYYRSIRVTTEVSGSFGAVVRESYTTTLQLLYSSDLYEFRALVNAVSDVPGSYGLGTALERAFTIRAFRPNDAPQF
jgi:hypothetical protein